jgi:hypothetical protein
MEVNLGPATIDANHAKGTRQQELQLNMSTFPQILSVPPRLCASALPLTSRRPAVISDSSALS